MKVIPPSGVKRELPPRDRALLDLLGTEEWRHMKQDKKQT